MTDAEFMLAFAQSVRGYLGDAVSDALEALANVSCECRWDSRGGNIECKRCEALRAFREKMEGK